MQTLLTNKKSLAITKAMTIILHDIITLHYIHYTPVPVHFIESPITNQVVANPRRKVHYVICGIESVSKKKK